MFELLILPVVKSRGWVSWVNEHIWSPPVTSESLQWKEICIYAPAASSPALSSITRHSKCTLILEEIWSVIIIMFKPLDFTAAHVHDSALIKEFHLPVGFPTQLSAPANKMC